MKIYELLATPPLSGVKLIAGLSGKNNEVHTVNMMDAPDIVPFLTQNELLVTTAYHLKDQPELLLGLIESMAAQGCAGLGIKTKRFLNEIPKEALQLADQLSFPIIELPLDLSLGEIINHTLRAILDRRANELTLAVDTHKHFTNIIMQGKGIEKLLQELEKMIQRPAQLINQQLEPAIHRNSRINPAVKLPKEAFSLPRTNMKHFSFSILSAKQTFTIFPIYMIEKKIGFLLITGEIKSDDQLTLLMIDQAINVLSFALMKEHAIKQHARTIRNDFFIHFLEGNFSSQEEITSRAAEFSLKNEQAYICAIGRVDDEHRHTYTQHQRKAEDIFEFIDHELTLLDIKAHLFTKSASFILLFEITEESKAEACVRSSLLHIQSKVALAFPNTVSFGISKISPTFLQLRNAFSEASEALSQGELSKQTAFIQSFRTKDTMELLRLIPEDELRNFHEYTLNFFTKENTEDEQALLQTLSVYLETHCQISETAKRLFVHRNTVVYRLEKCEEILGKSLKDSETTLQLRIALRIHTLLNT